MERFSDFRTFEESKDRLIDRMNLTGEQKQIAKDFFNKHNSYENEIDWNKWRTLTWEDLEKVIKKDRSMSSKQQVKKAIKRGLDGFEEGSDYRILKEGVLDGEPWVAYQPFTWEASRMIASKSVEPCDVEGAWCTAYQKEDFYWRHHTHEQDYSAFIYLCGESIPYGKVAIEVNDHLSENCDGLRFSYVIHGLHFNIWDKDDNRITFAKGAKDLKGILTEEFLRSSLVGLKEAYLRDEDLAKIRREREVNEKLSELKNHKVYKAIEDGTLKYVGDKNDRIKIYDYNGGDLDIRDIDDYNMLIGRLSRECEMESVVDFPIVMIGTWKGDISLHTMDLYKIRKVDGNCVIWNEIPNNRMFLDTTEFKEVTGKLLLKNDGVACEQFFMIGELKVGGRVSMDDFLYEDLVEHMDGRTLLMFLDKIKCDNFPLREELRASLEEK